MKTDFKFVVYTQSIIFFSPYRDALGNKLEIRDYIPRKELLYQLSQMDFLINIANNSSVQTPSKLIDYALTQRPIIEITSDFKEYKEFQEFLDGNYQRGKKIENLEQYNIVNVANNFLELHPAFSYCKDSRR